MKNNFYNHLNETGQYIPLFNLGKVQGKVELRLSQLEEMQCVLRLWSKDATLWNEPKGSKEITNYLGWLHVVEKMIAALPMLWKFEADIKAAGFTHVIVLGMGGSSLSSFVFNKTIQNNNQGIPLTVLDTTDPETILEAESNISLESTLFILASKSGNQPK